MVTIREYNTTRVIFENKINKFINELKASQFNVSVPLFEYCIYDTNTKLDKNWL